jgi:RimJ/RimL family protein N-acetyltransferase
MPQPRLPYPPLSDGEIVLRAWTLSDAPALTRACQDPEIPRWTVVPSPYEERHAHDFIAGCAASSARSSRSGPTGRSGPTRPRGTRPDPRRLGGEHAVRTRS